MQSSLRSSASSIGTTLIPSVAHARNPRSSRFSSFSRRASVVLIALTSASQWSDVCSCRPMAVSACACCWTRVGTRVCERLSSCLRPSTLGVCRLHWFLLQRAWPCPLRSPCQPVVSRKLLGAQDEFHGTRNSTMIIDPQGYMGRSGQSVTRVGADGWSPVSGPTKLSVSEFEGPASGPSGGARECSDTPRRRETMNPRRIVPKCSDLLCTSALRCVRLRGSHP